MNGATQEGPTSTNASSSGAYSAHQVVSGSHATGNNFRDFSGNFYAGSVQVGGSQFFTPQLEEFEPSSWVEPLAGPSLAASLKSYRILILSGPLKDKGDCASHIARLLHKSHGVSGGFELNIRTMTAGSDPIPIERELAESKPALLILREVFPRQLLGEGLNKLPTILQQNGGYVIITTSSSKQDWGIAEDNPLAGIWYDLVWENYYGEDLLRAFFRLQLRTLCGARIESFLTADAGACTLANGFPIRRIVEVLQGPRAIKEFSRHLTSLGSLPSPEEIERRLSALSDDTLAVSHWFRLLEPRNKTLALGLCLFEGLPEDLLFEGLEHLVSSSWRGVDPLLRQFEYDDLEVFSLYFKQTHSEEDLTRIECLSEKVKRSIVETLWRLHRRHLITAIPAITALVRQSASSEKSDTPEVEAKSDPRAKDNGHQKEAGAEQLRPAARAPRKTSQLHNALVEALRLFGQSSPKAVEPILLQLAKDADPNVRRFVARTLAAWITHDNELRVLDLLRRWWNRSRLLMQQGADGEWSLDSEHNPSFRIRATIGLTVAFAAPLYPANRLEPTLLKLFGELIVDTSETVREVVSLPLIPYVLENHLEQVKDLVRERALLSEDLVLPSAFGAALATAKRPEEGKRVLWEWKARAKVKSTSQSRSTSAGRERLLAAFASALGLVILTRNPTAIELDTVYGEFRSLLLEEWHPFVRSHVFSAMELQAEKNFDAVARLLVEVVSYIQLRERRNVAEVLTRIYMEQRKQLTGGTASYELDGSRYSLWPDSQRPMTGVEKTLMEWSVDPVHPIAQQVAIEALGAFGESPLERKERSLAGRPVTAEDSPVPGSSPGMPDPQNQQYHLPPLGRVALFLAARGKEMLRSTAASILAELLAVRRGVVHFAVGPMAPDLANLGLTTPSIRLNYVLWRLGSASNEGGKLAAETIGNALRLYKWRWPVIFAIVGLLYAFAK